MPTQDTDLDDFFWPERDEPDEETRTVLALLSFIGGGFGDGQQELTNAAAEDAGVSATFALSVLSRHAGPGSRSDHFWEVRRVSGRLQYRLVSPARGLSSRMVTPDPITDDPKRCLSGTLQAPRRA